MPVYPRLNFPIKRSPSTSSTANSSHESEAKSVPRLRSRRSLQQGLRSSPAAEHKDLDGINDMLDHMATTTTQDASSQQAEDARIASASQHGSGSRLSLPVATPSSSGQAAIDEKPYQQQPSLYSDPQMMAHLETAAIAQTNRELDHLKLDLAMAKSEQAKAEQQHHLAANTSNGATEKQQAPISNSIGSQQTLPSSDRAGQNLHTPVSNGIKQEQQTPISNGNKQAQQQIPISNGKPNPVTPTLVATPKYSANTTATVEASAKIKQLTKDVEAAGWELQNLKLDLGDVRSELGGVKREMSGMKGEVVGAKKEVKAVDTEVAGLKGDVASLKGIVETMAGQVGNLTRSLESTSGQMKELEKGAQWVKHDMEGLKEQVTDISSALTALTDLASQTQATLTNLTSQTQATLTDITSQTKNTLADAAAAVAAHITANTASPLGTTTTITPIKHTSTDPFNSSTPFAPGKFPTTPNPISPQTQTHAHANPAPARGDDVWDSTTRFCIRVGFPTLTLCLFVHNFLTGNGYQWGLLDREVYRDLVEAMERLVESLLGM